MNYFFIKLLLFISSFYYYADQYNEAEKGIVNGKYQNAFDAGIKAIKTYPKAHWSIILNTMILADSLNINDDIGIMSYEIGRRGVCLDYLKSFSFYIDNQSIIDSAWNSGNDIFKKSFKQDFLDSLFNMFDRDQNCRKNLVSNDSINIIDSMNMISFEKLARKYGFPNEFNIGLRYHKLDKGYIINEGFFGTMYRHFALHNYQSFKSILDNEFLIGSLDLYDYTYYISLYKKPMPPNFARYSFFTIESKYYKINYSESIIDSLNSVRKIYGMHSFEDNLNSFIYTIKNPETRFHIHGYGENIPMPPKEILSKLFTEIPINNESSYPDH